MAEQLSEQKPLPKHVVIIPDGNRRWATDRGLKPWEGHEAGAQNTERLVRQARAMGIRHVSIWGSSVENLEKRPLPETQALIKIYTTYFSKLCDSPDIHQDRARINFIGHWEEQFPSPLKKILYRCIESTKDYDQYFLNFFLAYSGDDEMMLAIRKIAAQYGGEPDAIDTSVIKRNLMTHELPPVDLLIRTGGEPHLSAGFMMWDIANSQLYFSDKRYPDFDEKEFILAIEDYQNRGRRFGK
ncbi:MAG: polyprenyl diphosphate synthase [Candidatus Moranbacteria bacterium]|nr:polyprenyl diphosphate synthase [Candidatus Moranbacteria bacterium]